MQKNSLSLCMIVRDEEENVGRAIKSALAVVDEVVVVDTGSSDNTRLIVEGYGARVIDFPWSDDFADARNAGLCAAYGDWVLVLDADEVLEPIRPVELGRLLSNEDAVAYYARIRDERPGRPSSVYDRVRIFRNHPEVRYRFPVHEDVVPAIVNIADRVGGEILPSGVTVVHYGDAEGVERGKRSRNQRLLRKAIAQNPNEPYFRYQMARELSVYLEDELLPMKGFGTLLQEIQEAAQQLGAQPHEALPQLAYGADLYALLSHALVAAGRHEEALVATEEGLDCFGGSSLLRFAHGVALLRAAEQGTETAEARRALAIERMESMLEGPDGLESAPISPSYFHLYPLRYLGLAAMQNEDFEGARAHFSRALETDPSYTAAWCGLAQLADREGRSREALQIYLKALKMNDSEWAAWLGGAEVLLRLGFRDNACSWLRKVHVLLPEHPGLPQILQDLGFNDMLLVESS